jgi:hypothetical protein
VSEATSILTRVQHGDPRAAAELPPLVDEELHKLAAPKLAQELPGQTLRPTALVHEAWRRIAGRDAT